MSNPSYTVPGSYKWSYMSLVWVITIVILLITPVITTHGAPSKKAHPLTQSSWQVPCHKTWLHNSRRLGVEGLGLIGFRGSVMILPGSIGP